MPARSAKRSVRILLFAEPKPAKAGCLKVTEHYACIEGEGGTLGSVTYLVRLSGCNLRCWWCDSKQSSFFDDEEKMLPAPQLKAAALASGAHWVSFTGGEPTWRSPAELKTLASLCKALRAKGCKIKIESNGLILPDELGGCVDLWSLAPKWDSSKAAERQQTKAMHYDIGRLNAFMRHSPPAGLQLKFVIGYDAEGELRAGELQQVSGILKALKGRSKPPVFFVPEAYAAGDYLERCRSLNDAVEKLAPKLKGWDLRVQPQWHRVLYADERGR